MPLYDFRCDAQDGSGNFRRGTINADSEEDGRAILEGREADRSAWQMDPDRIDELCDAHGVSDLDSLPYAADIDASEDEKDAGLRQLPVRDRAHLNIHRQDKPFKLKKFTLKDMEAEQAVADRGGPAAGGAITVKLYGLTAEKIVEQAGNDVNWLTGTVKASLHTSTYSVNRDTDDFFNDATNELGGGAGYTVQTLGGKTVTYDSGSDEVRQDCNDITYSFSGSNTWRYGVVWIDTAGASSTDPLYGLLTWDSDQTVSTTYTLTIDAAGLFFWDTT